MTNNQLAAAVQEVKENVWALAEANWRRPAIWLEVTEVSYDSEKAEQEKGVCSVQLKGDREQPKAVWWPVDVPKALGKDAFETYKALLEQIDKKRLVLARLSCSTEADHHLRCDAFRFQSTELGSR